MQIERVFTKGTKKTTVVMSVDKGQVETVVTVVTAEREEGKETRESEAVSKWAFETFAKLVQKHLKAGMDLASLKDAPKIAEQLLGQKALDLDLSDILDVFNPEERLDVVRKQVEKADAAKKVVGPDHAYARASILQKCPSQPLLHHFLARLHDGSLKYTYEGGGLNGDLQFFASAISSASREPSNRAWIVEEVNRVLPVAEPVLKNWLKARISKFNEQTKTQAALKTAPKKPAMLEEGLLAEIGKDPANDAPRQVWADWLTEQNHPWGEVVLLQCEREKVEDNSRRDEINERLQKIESRAQTKFLAPIKAFIAEFGIERGLLRRVTVSVDKLLKDGAAEAIILRAPGAEISLTGLKKTHVAQLRKLPRGAFGSLKLGTKPPPDVLEALVQSPLIEGVKEIEVWGVDDKTIDALTKANPTAVRSLTLWYSTAGAKAFGVLAKAPALKGLEELHVPFPKELLPHAAVESIASMKTLRALNLSISEGGCGAALSNLKSLESLTLHANGHWDDNDCAALAKTTAPLTSLDIRGTAATAKGASRLLGYGKSSLHLEYTGAGLDFTSVKAGAGSAKLVSPAFSDADASALAKSAFGKKLEFLEIKSDVLGDKGAEALMTLPAIGSSLYVEGGKISAKTSKKLAALRGE